MQVGIHPDYIWGTNFSERWVSYFNNAGVKVKTLNLLADDALKQVQDCDGVMWRWAHRAQDKQSAKMILYAIERYLNLPVFPDNNTAWHFDEKVAQKYLLEALGAPVPASWAFWDHGEAVAWAKAGAKYPVVFKLSVGAGSSSVEKVDTPSAAVSYIDRMFDRGIFPMTMNEFRHRILPRSRHDLKRAARRALDATRYAVASDYPRLDPEWWRPEHGYAYFQEFLPGNSFDTRITVIGDRAFGFRRFNRPNDFRASGSGNIDYDPKAVDLRCVELAFDISRKGNFQSMAYDFLYRDNEPVVCEISYTFADYAVHACPGHWDSKLGWHEGNMWPQDAQAMDFLESMKARQPRQ